MSPGDDKPPVGGPSTEDDQVRAAEAALNLDPEAERALARDPSMQRDVDRWADHFAALGDEVEPVPPRAAVWKSIRDAMDPAPVAAPRPRSPSRWRELVDNLRVWQGLAAAGWAGALAMILVFASSGAPEVDPPANPPVLVSSLLPRDGGPLYVVTFDPGRARMVVVPTAPPREQGRVVELWLVPNDTDDPIALSTIGGERPQVIGLAVEQVRFVSEGAGLVITLEPSAPNGSSPAQGPVIAHGRLIRL